MEALRAYTAKGVFVPDLSVARRSGTTFTARWVPVPDRDATSTSIRDEFDLITRSRQLGGMWWGDGGAYFVASSARNEDGSTARHDGQVWFLDPARDTIELKLRFAYTLKDEGRDPGGPDDITGPNFSHDRKWLFANIQDPSIVFAITGPWTGNGTK